MTRPRRLLLLWPGALWAGRHVRPSLPLKFPLLGLFSYLETQGLPVEVLDLHTELGLPEPEQTAVDAYIDRGMDLLEARSFDVLAISCWSSFDYLASRAFAARVKSRDSSVPIVVGGYHASAMPQEFTRPGEPFDYVVIGEGEEALLGLAGRQSLTVRHAAEMVTGTSPPMGELPMDILGYPYCTGRPAKLDIYLSRGCPYRCAFCAGSSQGRGWRAYDIGQSTALIRTAASLRPHTLDLLDACFGCNRRWRRELLGALAELELPMPVSFQTRAESLSTDELEALSALDVEVQLGVETLSPAMAEIMHKARDGRRYVGRVLEVLEQAESLGVSTNVNILVNHPGETPATLEETVGAVEEFVARHERLALGVATAVYTFFPGSEVHRRQAHYEAAYGTVIRHPRWWHEQAPHTPLSSDVGASARLSDYRPWLDRLRDARRDAIGKWTAEKQLQALRRRRHLVRDQG